MEGHNLVGLGLIIGAGIGFVIGLVIIDPQAAAVTGAMGAGVGLVVGAIMQSFVRHPHRR